MTSLVDWGIFDNFHIFIFFDSFGGYQNSYPMPALLHCHRLNIDRCMINIDGYMIKASDHGMLDYA